MSQPPPEALVIDASALVEALLGTRLGVEVRTRMRGHVLHAPAHLDAEVLSALGRLHRAQEIQQSVVADALEQLAAAPITRHPLAALITGAWKRRANQRLVDALYTELAALLDVTALLTTDARLARSENRALLVT
ncbi:MAG TPA: PIN domain-containing protein [Solirubrobacteraceae bacterium]|nr:PIN domain-containing protein [Solirubrobacteraceae bacterium]